MMHSDIRTCITVELFTARDAQLVKLLYVLCSA